MGKDMMVQLLRVNMLNCFTSPHFFFCFKCFTIVSAKIALRNGTHMSANLALFSKHSKKLSEKSNIGKVLNFERVKKKNLSVRYFPCLLFGCLLICFYFEQSSVVLSRSQTFYATESREKHRPSKKHLTHQVHETEHRTGAKGI